MWSFCLQTLHGYMLLFLLFLWKEIQWVCIRIHLLMMVSRVVLLGHKRKKRKTGRIDDPFFFVFTLFKVHHGFNTCKLLLIEFLTNLLQDFFLGLEGKNPESCFLPKERQTHRQTETVSDFFLSLGETKAFGFYCLLFYFLLLCWD